MDQIINSDSKCYNVITFNIRDNVADNSGVQYNVCEDDALKAYNIECT